MSLPPAPELLAPARNLQVALAAFDEGADAVYVGLHKFNARRFGENFSEDDLARLLSYARTHSKRVYVTLNTLIKETELDGIAEVLAQLSPLRPNGIMVQDLGLARLIQTYFPDLPVHGSTQIGIHNSAGVEMLAKLGFERVVLERQLSLEEVSAIAQHAPIEIEVFIHGALCCSLSGQCLFSSWMGGYSGNRGVCKQPCRRRYRSTKGNGFFFSPQDLYMLDLLTPLQKAGVSSLKIEGRLQNENYVRHVVSAYRTMLDTPLEERDATLPSARAELAKALGRRWSHGFYVKEEIGKLIEHDRIAASGLLCGRVAKAVPGGFLMKPSKPFFRYDRLRVQPTSGEEGPAFAVKEILVNDKQTKSAPKGQTCFVACNHVVEPDSYVYLVSKPISNMQERLDRLTVPDTLLDLRITVALGELSVTLHPATGTPAQALTWQTRANIESARNQAVSVEDITTEFLKAMPDAIQASRIDVILPDTPLFIRNKDLRNLRQSFWHWVEEQRVELTDEQTASDQLETFRHDQSEAVENTLSPNKHKVSDTRVWILAENQSSPRTSAKSQQTAPTRICREIHDTALTSEDEVLLPSFCPENRLTPLLKKIETLLSKGFRAWRIPSLYGFPLLTGAAERQSLNMQKDLQITASFPLPVCNHFTLSALQDQCADGAMLWTELSAEDMTSLIHHRTANKLHLSQLVYGRIPLLITRAPISANGTIHDNRGNTFEIVSYTNSSLTGIHPERPLQAQRVCKCLASVLDYRFDHKQYRQPSNARDTGASTTDFNLAREWK